MNMTDRVVDLYIDKELSVEMVGKTLGLSKWFVRKALHEAGYNCRDCQDARNLALIHGRWSKHKVGPRRQPTKTIRCRRCDIFFDADAPDSGDGRCIFCIEELSGAKYSGEAKRISTSLRRDSANLLYREEVHS